MATALGALLNIIAPKKKTRPGGSSVTSTYRPNSSDRPLSAGNYQEHLTDVSTTRISDDSRSLVKYLMVHDPDMSATTSAYLTLANTEPTIIVRDIDGEIDREATRDIHKAIEMLTRTTDYTLGFQLKPDFKQICAEMRYMLMMRGGIGAELVLDKQLMPSKVRHVDLTSIEWYERQPGEYKPRQKVEGNNTGIDLDIPTFFVSFYRRDPTTIYSNSSFVSAINTIAARQQVINDLYRIMRRTGYPRMAVKIVEEVLTKNVPVNLANKPDERETWKRARMDEIQSALTNLRADEILTHWDSTEPYIINEKNPGVGIDVSEVIATLNAQNQAGLKTMATVIGRGQAGINTGSVEARIAAMNADELNQPVAEIMSDLLSFILHYQGYQGFVEVSFAPAELRPDLELEPQRNMRQARLRKDLSDGIITDDEYHMWMYGRLRPDSAPELSGTKFLDASSQENDVVDPTNITPNGDPLGRSLAPEGSNSAKSNTMKGRK